ncbi:MAG: hypothetical protein ACM3XS_04160 [Bacteroidota bacterium]
MGRCGIFGKWERGDAHLIAFGFYDYYVTHSGPWTCGWPLSDEYVSGGYTWQDFEFGRLKWSAGTGVVWIPN